MDIIAALDAPSVFKPAFTRGEWKAWRTFLRALFALDMDAAALDLYRTHTGRQTPPLAPFSEAALIVGRRGGKSRILALLGVFLACFRSYAEFLAPGEVATVGILASDRRQAGGIVRYIIGMLEAVPALNAMIKDRTDESITLNNRVVIEVSTASFRATRGFTYAACLCDEVAFWRGDENSANPDIEILRALRPGMSTIPGAILLLASSPYGKKGALYDSFRRYWGNDTARVLIWQASTLAMNPTLNPAIVAEAYETDPESAKAEYGGSFRDDLADFVSREQVDAVTCWGRTENPPEDGVTYSCFIDPSGGVQDSMCLAIAHTNTAGLGVLDLLLEIRPPFNPDLAVAECADVMRRYGVTRAVGDHYGGAWVPTRFREYGIDYIPSARPKSDLYHDFAPLLNAKRIELLEHARMSAQLVALERRTGRSGRDSIDHRPGGHDDAVNVVAGVLVGLDLDRRPAIARAGQLTVAGAGYPTPKRCDFLFATVAAGLDGTLATVYCARQVGQPVPLVIVDFSIQPISGATLAGVTARLHELIVIFGAWRGALGAFVPDSLRDQSYIAGLPPHSIPETMQDADALAISVATHIAAGRVKITADVLEKAQSTPFAAALDFRSGDRAETPLRVAALQAIALSLNGEAFSQ